MGTICGCSMEYYQCQWLLRRRHEKGDYYRKKWPFNIIISFPNISGNRMPIAGRHLLLHPPQFHLMTFGKVTVWNWTRTCVCSLTVEWIARVVPGQPPCPGPHRKAPKLPDREVRWAALSRQIRKVQKIANGTPGHQWKEKASAIWTLAPGHLLCTEAVRGKRGCGWGSDDHSWPVIKIFHWSYPCPI